MHPAPVLSPLKTARREKIIAAAERYFIGNGLRSATMEGIAASAGISKVTVYGYFDDKDQIFQAVAARLAERLLAAVRTELGKSGSIRTRIAAALIAKHGLVDDLLKVSPYAGELMAAKEHVAAAIMAELDGAIEALIAAEIARQYSDADSAAATARLLFGSALGIAGHCRSMQMAAGDIVRLVDAVLPDP